MIAFEAVGIEVAAIDAEDGTGIESFGGNDEAGIREIHSLVPVFLHQFEGVLQGTVGQEPDAGPAMGDQGDEVL